MNHQGTIRRCLNWKLILREVAMQQPAHIQEGVLVGSRGWEAMIETTYKQLDMWGIHMSNFAIFRQTHMIYMDSYGFFNDCQPASGCVSPSAQEQANPWRLCTCPVFHTRQYTESPFSISWRSSGAPCARSAAENFRRLRRSSRAPSRSRIVAVS